MSLVKQLVRAEMVALGWLAACAAAFASWVSITYLADPTLALTDRLSQALGLAAVFLAFGALPVILYGAPVYVWLQRSSNANWWSALLVGLLPGVIALPLELSLGMYALIAGGIVSLLTHLVIGRRPNNSFKPNPLRGSA